jgi:hypothetical protein
LDVGAVNTKLASPTTLAGTVNVPKVAGVAGDSGLVK